MFPISVELAEEIGWHIGDGSMNIYEEHDGKEKGFYQLRGHIKDDRLHYLERIKPLFDKIYGTNISLREMPSTRVFGFQIWNNAIIGFKQKLGLPLGKKYELEIPKVFLDETNYLKACIRGIFDTDGCVYLEKKNNKLYPHVQITTISDRLATQLTEVFNKLGMRATKCKNIDNRTNNNRLPSYKIDIRGVQMLHNFFTQVNPQNKKHIEKYNFFLKSIQKP